MNASRFSSKLNKASSPSLMLPEGCHGGRGVGEKEGGSGRWQTGSSPPPSLPPLAGHLPSVGVGMGSLPLGRQTGACTWCFHSRLLASVDDPGDGERNCPLLLLKRDLTFFCWGKCCRLAARVLGGIPSYFSRNGTKIPLIFLPCVRVFTTNFGDSHTAELLVFFNTSTN